MANDYRHRNEIITKLVPSLARVVLDIVFQATLGYGFCSTESDMAFSFFPCFSFFPEKQCLG